MNDSIGIRELASKTGATQHTLRYYETAGLMIPVDRNAQGRRVYSADHVRWVRFLGRLREGGMGIKRIREYVGLLSEEADPNGTRRFAILTEHRDEVLGRIKRLQEHLAILDRKVESGCQPDSRSAEELTMPVANDPAEVVRTLYGLFADGRLEETYNLMDPGVVLLEPGDPAILPWAGRFEGHDGLRRFYEGLNSGLKEVAIDPDSLSIRLIDHEQVLAIGTERAVARQTDKAYQSQSVWLWTVRDGLITHLFAYHDTASMTEAMTV